MPAVNAPVTAGPVGSSQGTEAISLPLYGAGLVVTLSGVLTVTTAVAPSGGTPIGSVALLLTLLGFAFSVACRHLRVQSRWIEVGSLAFVAYIGYQILTRHLDLDWFLAGADRSDTRLAAGLMWLAVLRSWTLLSDDLVVFSCVLTAAMIGLIGTQDVNTVTIVYFTLFVLAMVFLLIHQNWMQSRALASPDERARPGLRLLPIQVGLTALCGLGVLGLGALLSGPAQIVFEQVSMASAIRGLVGAVPSHDDAASSVTERFSDDSRFDIGTGSVWPTTSEVLLHVSPSDDAPHYWRGRTYDLYVGSSWRSTVAGSSPISLRGETSGGRLYAFPPQSLPAGEGLVTPRSMRRPPMVAAFEVLGDTDQFYYADEPRDLLVDPGAGADPRLSLDGRMDLGGRPVRSVFTISSAPPPDLERPEVQERLRRDGADYPEDVSRLYLSPPVNADNTVTSPADILALKRVLAQALAGLPPGRRTPFDKASAIRDWIAGHCVYSLQVPPTPDGVDPVRDFLAHSRRGYCDLFASSQVILCRLAGIPARVATGFAPGDRDSTGFNLRAMDKHAWAEVYFPNDRWQVFDATVGTRTDGTLPTASPPSASFWLRAWRAVSGSGPVPVVLVALITLSLLYLVKTELWDRWRASRPPSLARPSARGGAAPEVQYARVARALARLGLPRRPWETPGEYQSRALPWLRDREAALAVGLRPDAVSQVTDHFVAARYGGPDEAGGASLDSTVADFERAAARARRRAAWRQFWAVGRRGQTRVS